MQPHSDTEPTGTELGDIELGDIEPSDIEPGDAPVTRVTPGMAVTDSAGQEAGTVAAVQPPGTDVRPDLSSPDAEHLMVIGYLRIDGSGALANDVYAAGNQVAEVSADSEGRVVLTVTRDELHRAV
jgi:hypothetical protein